MLPSWALRVYPWEEVEGVLDGGGLGSTAGELDVGRMPDNKPMKMPSCIQDPSWHHCFLFLDGEKGGFVCQFESRADALSDLMNSPMIR